VNTLKLASRPKATASAKRGVVAEFLRAEDGAAMLETLIVLPVFLIFAAGLFEFGGLLFFKLEVETGLRDAARYVARCRDINPSPGSPTFNCSEATAQNIAVYGPSGSTPRVPGWSPSDVIFQYRTVANPVVSGVPKYNEVGDVWIVDASTDINYPGGPLLGLTGIPFIQIAAHHQERYIGW
jgi:Flp pilus assembly protein TadG